MHRQDAVTTWPERRPVMQIDGAMLSSTVASASADGRVRARRPRDDLADLAF
jgi:hypothetical protein